MNYKKLYDNIIENRKNNPIKGYKERHHIIPRSLGGIDSKENLVDLTAREHFICHYLLVKMYPKFSFEWYKMNHAFMMMKCQSLNQYRYFNSHLYESLRENFSKVMSFTQNGEKNSQYETMWVYNQETLESKKIKGDIPDGWKRGRKLPKKVSKYKTFSYKLKKIFKKIKKSNLQKQKRIKAEELIRKESEYYQKLFDDYINSDFKSMREFVKKTNYEFSHVTLTKKFKKYITDYNKIIKPFTTKK